MRQKQGQDFHAVRMEYAREVETDQGKEMAKAGDYVCTLKENGETRNWLMREADFNSVMREIAKRGHGGRGFGLLYDRWLKKQKGSKKIR